MSASYQREISYHRLAKRMSLSLKFTQAGLEFTQQ